VTVTVHISSTGWIAIIAIIVGFHIVRSILEQRSGKRPKRNNHDDDVEFDCETSDSDGNGGND
jgi:hypothetical protein